MPVDISACRQAHHSVYFTSNSWMCGKRCGLKCCLRRALANWSILINNWTRCVFWLSFLSTSVVISIVISIISFMIMLYGQSSFCFDSAVLLWSFRTIKRPYLSIKLYSSHKQYAVIEKVQLWHYICSSFATFALTFVIAVFLEVGYVTASNKYKSIQIILNTFSLTVLGQSGQPSPLKGSSIKWDLQHSWSDQIEMLVVGLSKMSCEATVRSNFPMAAEIP